MSGVSGASGIAGTVGTGGSSGANGGAAAGVAGSGASGNAGAGASSGGQAGAALGGSAAGIAGSSGGVGGSAGSAGTGLGGQGGVATSPPASLPSVGPCALENLHYGQPGLTISVAPSGKSYLQDPPCFWVVAGTTVAFEGLSAANPLFGMMNSGSQPNPIVPNAPHVAGAFSVMLTEPYRVFGFYDGKLGSDSAPGESGMSGAVYVLGGAQHPPIAGCSPTGMANTGGTVIVTLADHAFQPPCLDVVADTTVVFKGISAAHPLGAMLTQGNVPNVLTAGAPYVTDGVAIKFASKWQAIGFFDALDGADAPPGNSGVSGAIYVYDYVP